MQACGRAGTQAGSCLRRMELGCVPDTERTLPRTDDIAPGRADAHCRANELVVLCPEVGDCGGPCARRGSRVSVGPQQAWQHAARRVRWRRRHQRETWTLLRHERPLHSQICDQVGFSVTTGYLRSSSTTAEGGVIWWSPSDMPVSLK